MSRDTAEVRKAETNETLAGAAGGAGGWLESGCSWEGRPDRQTEEEQEGSHRTKPETEKRNEFYAN